MKNIPIPDITAEMIMATVECLSKRKGEHEYISEYIGTSLTTVKRAVNFGILLGLFEQNEQKEYQLTNQCKSISSLYHENPAFIFKSAIFNFNPFILCSSLILNDNSLTDAIRKMCAVFNIQSDQKIITRVLNNFCRYIGLDSMSKQSLSTIVGKGSISEDFAERIVTRLNNEFQTSTFLSEKLGEQCFAYVSNPEKKLIVKAILMYHKEPANAISDFAGAFESFLRRIGKDKNINLEACNGISQLGQVLGSKDNRVILPEHKALCEFFSAFRNPSSHKVQKNLIEHWNIGMDSSIEIILLGISSKRSIYEYVFNNKLLL